LSQAPPRAQRRAPHGDPASGDPPSGRGSRSTRPCRARRGASPLLASTESSTERPPPVRTTAFEGRSRSPLLSRRRVRALGAAGGGPAPLLAEREPGELERLAA